MLDMLRVFGLAAAEQAAGIGKTAKPHDFLDGKAVADEVVLRQDADGLCAACGLHFFYILSFKQDAAGIWCALRNGGERSGFSGPVRTDDHEPLSLRNGEGERIDDRFGSIPHGKAVGLQHRHVNAPFSTDRR